MINTFKTRLTLAAAVMAVAAFAPQGASAQTEPVVASVTVQNTLTITEQDPLAFGTVAAMSDDTETATLTISPITGVVSHTSSGAPAVFAVIDDTAASPALIDVENGADGATINVTIDNVVDPVYNGSAFTLDDFTTRWNGSATATNRTIGTSFTQIFDGSHNAGVNQLTIGASLETLTTVTTYEDGTYLGGFDVVFSY